MLQQDTLLNKSQVQLTLPSIPSLSYREASFYIYSAYATMSCHANANLSDPVQILVDFLCSAVSLGNLHTVLLHVLAQRS